MVYGERICIRGCNRKIVYKGKTGERGSTGYFEVDLDGNPTDQEHTYNRCDDIIGDRIVNEEKAAKKKLEAEKVKAEHGGGLDAFT